MRWVMAILVVGGVVLSGYASTATVSESGVLPNGPMDAHGPGVADAVMDYRVDPLGNVFESHAPDIAIPTLPDPST